MQERSRSAESVAQREPDEDMSIPDRNDIIEDLIKTYGEALTRFFMRRTIDLAEAEEMTNELFFRLIRRLDREKVENPQAFLFHAAANLVNDRYRRSKARQVFSQRVAHMDGDSHEELSPERVLISKQSLQVVLKSLDSLDSRARDVFLLHRVQGLKYAEIARLLGISVSSVEKYIMKCLVQISKHTAGGA